MADDNDVDVSLFFTVKQKDKSAMINGIVRAICLMSTTPNMAAHGFAYPMVVVLCEDWFEVL